MSDERQPTPPASGGGGSPAVCNTAHCPLHPDVVVTEVKFQSIVNIWYARIPSSGSYILPATADATPPHKHFSPVEVRPAAGGPHWRQGSAASSPEFSWPGVYLRRGAAGAPAAQLTASFETLPPVSVSAKIKAQTSTGIVLAEKTVSFSGGVASNVTFDIQNLPATAKKLDGIEFQWTYQVGSDPEKTANSTKHTLFIVDERPKPANNRYVDQYLWEIFEWSCGWADGVTGHQAVLDAVWGHFNPVQSSHETGLVYWKNHNIGISPAQDLVTAIQSQDDPNVLQKSAASCIVFDRVLLNCLAVHGIACAEIMIAPDRTAFSRGGANLSATGWHDTTTNGQGNSSAPPFWNNHWIADVELPGSQWKIYDASYGAGPSASGAPTGATVNVFNYEPLTVDYFTGRNLGTGAAAPPISRSSSQAVPPHLKGDVLWKT